jgi:hypothetical protein
MGKTPSKGFSFGDFEVIVNKSSRKRIHHNNFIIDVDAAVNLTK